MTLSNQHPWIFIYSIIYYGAFSHAFFSSDALLLKSGAQAQRKGSSFRPHNIFFIFFIKEYSVYYQTIYVNIFIVYTLNYCEI